MAYLGDGLVSSKTTTAMLKLSCSCILCMSLRRANGVICWAAVSNDRRPYDCRMAGFVEPERCSLSSSAELRINGQSSECPRRLSVQQRTRVDSGECVRQKQKATLVHVSANRSANTDNSCLPSHRPADHSTTQHRVQNHIMFIISVYEDSLILRLFRALLKTFFIDGTPSLAGMSQLIRGGCEDILQ